jgi:hypothetical protein
MFEIPASEASDGTVNPRSIWLMKPVERPAASATACMVRPNSLRLALRRLPISGTCSDEALFFSMTKQLAEIVF